eukprot:2815850-Rhodomonas_salina.1
MLGYAIGQAQDRCLPSSYWCDILWSSSSLLPALTRSVAQAAGRPPSPPCPPSIQWVWLDLTTVSWGSGPIPWRSEIEEGIRESAKMVAFIDKAYLYSFNCLQELAFARKYSKPIVVIILEQDAVDLLTRPDGAASVWEVLKKFEGKSLTPGSDADCPLTELEVASLFEMLSCINFCMSSPLDFFNDTDKVILRRVDEFVSVELAYQVIIPAPFDFLLRTSPRARDRVGLLTIETAPLTLSAPHLNQQKEHAQLQNQAM